MWSFSVTTWNSNILSKISTYLLYQKGTHFATINTKSGFRKPIFLKKPSCVPKSYIKFFLKDFELFNLYLSILPTFCRFCKQRKMGNSLLLSPSFPVKWYHIATLKKKSYIYIQKYMYIFCIFLVCTWRLTHEYIVSSTIQLSNVRFGCVCT